MVSNSNSSPDLVVTETPQGIGIHQIAAEVMEETYKRHYKLNAGSDNNFNEFITRK